jgi:hypothetical protein
MDRAFEIADCEKICQRLGEFVKAPIEGLSREEMFVEESG